MMILVPGADAAEGDPRRFLGFEREPWFNVHQVDGVASQGATFTSRRRHHD